MGKSWLRRFRSRVRGSHNMHEAGPVLEALEPRRLLSATLDPAFGAGGVVQTDLTGDLFDYALEVLRQEDGKIVLVGESTRSINTTDFQYSVARLNPDGSLDESFGVGGKVQPEFAVEGLRVRGAVLDDAGGIVIVGHARLSGDLNTAGLAMLRLAPDGTRDMTFGEGGVVQENFGGSGAEPLDLYWDRGGLLVVGTRVVTTPSTNRDALLARYTATGQLDPQFGGGDGWVTHHLGWFDVARAAISDDQGITVVVDTNGLNSQTRNIAAIRYDAAGQLVTSYGVDGVAAHFLGNQVLAKAAVGTPDGGVLVSADVFTGGQASWDVLVVKLTSTGALDTAFSNDGLQLLNLNGFSSDRAMSMALDPSGRILIAGHSTPNAAVVRLLSSGELDPSFSGNGVAVDMAGVFNALLVEPDGHVLAAGTSTSDMLLARFSDDGTLAPSLGGDGSVQAGFIGSQRQHIFNLVTQADGRIIAVGESHSASANDDLLVMRYNVDGTLDTTFGGGDGWLSLDIAAVRDAAIGVALDAQGRAVITGVGSSPGASLIIRLTTEGELDATFGDGGVVIADYEPPNSTGASTILWGVVVDSAGGIVVSGSYNGDVVLARYLENGVPDLSFGPAGTGLVTRNLGSSDTATDIKIDSAGRLVVAAQRGPVSTGFWALRFTSDGRPDTSFGGGDGVASAPGLESGTARAIAIDSQDRPIIAGIGSATLGGYFTAARFTAHGEPDTTFGGDGAVTSVAGPGSGAALDVLVDAFDRIILAGYAPGFTTQVAVVRYLDHGGLDPAFDGEDGIIAIDIGTAEKAYAVALDTQGRLIVGGNLFTSATHDDALLVRWNLIEPENNQPLAYGSTVIVPEDGSVAGQANARDFQNDPLTFSLVTAPTHGALTFGDDGAFIYTPAANYFGPDSFSFTASDGEFESNEATVSVVVTAVNDVPVGGVDSYIVLHSRATTIAAPGLLGNDSDIDGDRLSVALVTMPQHGSLSVNITTGSFTYTPQKYYTGSDSFQYRPSDGPSQGEIVNVELTVINSPPTVFDAAFTVIEDHITTLTLPPHADAENDAVGLSIVDRPPIGSARFDGSNRLIYTPAPNWSGVVALTYKATDGAAESNLATVTITVAAFNDRPVVAGEQYSVIHDKVLVVEGPGVLANDSDVETANLSAVVERAPYGTLTLDPQGGFIYTPPAGFYGTDSFTYRAWDGQNFSTSAATVTIKVINTVPVPADAVYYIDEDTPLTGQLAAFDAEGDALTINHGVPIPGRMVVNPDGTFVYTPYENWFGTDDHFTYRLSDGLSWSDSARITIHVLPVDDAPIANDDHLEIREDGGFIGLGSEWVVFNDFDAERAPLTATLVEGASNGQLTFDSGGGFEYLPNPGFHGIDTFKYQVTDGNLTSNVATMTIDVIEFGAPSNLTAAVSGSNVTLNWVDNTGGYARYWRVERSGAPHRKTGAFDFQTIGYATGPSPTFTHSSSSGTWYYRVIAHEADYTSDPSTVLAVTVGSSKGGGKGGKNRTTLASTSNDALLTATIIEQSMTTTSASTKQTDHQTTGGTIDLLALVKSGVTLTTGKAR